MRSSHRLALGAVSALAAVTTVACRDEVVAPRSAESAPQGPALIAPPTVHVSNVSSGDTTISSFTLNGNGGTWVIVAGEHKMIFADGLSSICDPAVSSYGPTEWDKPCTPASQPITITAKVWTNMYGRSQIDFSPALRFVPTSQVTLQMYDKSAFDGTLPSHVNYCPTLMQCVDESLSDPSLATYKGTNGFFNRRIKHFSGYIVAVDRDGLGDDSGM